MNRLAKPCSCGGVMTWAVGYAPDTGRVREYPAWCCPNCGAYQADQYKVTRILLAQAIKEQAPKAFWSPWVWYRDLCGDNRRICKQVRVIREYDPEANLDQAIRGLTAKRFW